MEGGAEERAGVEVDEGGDDIRAALDGQGAQGGGAFLGDVFDGCGEQVLAGGEVVLGGAA